MNKLIGIDVVFPIGSMEWLPYLHNACRFVMQQQYPRKHMGIIISYLYRQEEPLTQLVELCREFEATLVMAPGGRDAFETPLARNMGARRAGRDAIAFIDCDVAIHPRTFRLASTVLDEKTGVILPVADMDGGPEDEIFTCTDPEALEREAWWRGWRRRDALGAIVVPRSAVFAVRGYDERMYGWGADDTDFVTRLRKYGVAMVALQEHGCPFAMHQKHGTARRESVLTHRNRQLLTDTTSIVRNETTWGGIPDAPDPGSEQFE